MPEPVRKEQLETLAISLRLIASKQDGWSDTGFAFISPSTGGLFLGH